VIIPQSATGNYPYVSGTAAVHGVNFLNSLNPPAGNNYRITIDPLGKLQINSSLSNGGFVMCTAIGNQSAPNPTISGTGIVEFMATSLNPANNQHFIQFNGNVNASTQILLAGATGVKTNASLTTNNRLTFPNNAVLLSGGVQTSVPALNYGGNVLGNIRYVRTGSQYGKYDYWSAPIMNATASVLNTQYGNNLYDYDNTRAGAVTDVQKGWDYDDLTPPIDRAPASLTMTPGKGFIQTFAGNGEVTFNGLPTQVNLDREVTVNGSNNFNLVGNPYPSALNTSLFRSRNSGPGKVGLGSLYLWNQSSESIIVGDYAVVNSFNLIAGGTPPGDWSPAQIGPAQGFMIDVANSGDLEFRNDDRVPNYPASNTQWFSNPESVSLLRLEINNNNGLKHNTLIAFSELSSDSFMIGEDSPCLSGSTGVEIYSLLAPRKLSIQMFSPLTSDRIVDLGFTATAQGQYSIKLTEFEAFDPTVRVYLEDRATGTFHNLNASSTYPFDPGVSFDGVRFRLHFIAPIATLVSGTCVGETRRAIFYPL
jgi:hypothetical protein